MKFAIHHFEDNGLVGIRLLDTDNACSVDVLPAHGMLLHAFRIPYQNELFNVIDHYTGKEQLQQEIALSYKGCKMSPFACRIPGGKYAVNGKQYEVQRKFIDGSAIHGLLSDKSFEEVNTQSNNDSASATASYHYDREDEGFPFQYSCEIKYTLLPSFQLTVETTVSNDDEQVIPIADGWHPYFTLGGLINEYTLQFESKLMLEFNEHLVPSGRTIVTNDFIKPAIIRERELDNCFALQLTDEGPCCILKNPLTNLALSIHTDKRYPFLQVFTPDHRQSIALENLSGAPNCFNNKMGLILLEPGNSMKFWVKYKLSGL